MNEDTKTGLIIPFLGDIYERLEVIAETILRVVTGIALIVHGFPKIMDPFGAVDMVEGLGFYPGVFWAPLLAVVEFFGGILLTIGLLTRPAAFAAMIGLAVTIWFHWITLGQGYSGSEKSILWTAILLFFVMRGGNRLSVDAMIGRQF